MLNLPFDKIFLLNTVWFFYSAMQNKINQQDDSIREMEDKITYLTEELKNVGPFVTESNTQTVTKTFIFIDMCIRWPGVKNCGRCVGGCLWCV